VSVRMMEERCGLSKGRYRTATRHFYYIR